MGAYFCIGAYFCMGAYKRDVVVVIKMGACIHGMLILCGCLLSRFYGMQRAKLDMKYKSIFHKKVLGN